MMTTTNDQLKWALDLLLMAYEPEATLNDINLILSIVMAEAEEE